MIHTLALLTGSTYQGRVIAWTLSADAGEFTCDLKVRDGEGGPRYCQGIASTVDVAIRRALERAGIAV